MESVGKAVTTNLIAETLGISQQSVSTHLIELEKLGLIERMKKSKGEQIQVTPQGLTELEKLYHVLGSLLEPSTSDLVLKGVIFSGLGEGAYYVSQSGYLPEFQEKLGFTPYPGTLNVRLIESSISERKRLEQFTPIIVKGFKTANRSFGDVKCYRASLNDSELCAVISALRTHYGDDILEIISPFNLRKKLHVKDGRTVTIRVFSTFQ
jgi:riboflavin kinase